MRRPSLVLAAAAPGRQGARRWGLLAGMLLNNMSVVCGIQRVRLSVTAVVCRW